MAKSQTTHELELVGEELHCRTGIEQCHGYEDVQTFIADLCKQALAFASCSLQDATGNASAQQSVRADCQNQRCRALQAKHACTSN